MPPMRRMANAAGPTNDECQEGGVVAADSPAIPGIHHSSFLAFAADKAARGICRVAARRYGLTDT